MAAKTLRPVSRRVDTPAIASAAAPRLPTAMPPVRSRSNGATCPSSNRSWMNGGIWPPARSSPTSSTSRPSRCRRQQSSAATPARCLVWSGTSPRKLLGFFPARIETRRYGLKLPVLVGWTNPYAPLGTPLVEREAAEPVIAAWLAHLADDPELPGLVLLPFLPTGRPVRGGARCHLAARADAGRRFQSLPAGAAGAGRRPAVLRRAHRRPAQA